MKKVLKSVNIWQSYKEERDCLAHFERLANALLKDGGQKSKRMGRVTQSTTLPVTSPNVNTD